MSKNENEPTATPPAEPGTTPATQPQSAPVATQDPSAVPQGYELIKTEDKKNLISARDKATNSNSETDAILGGLLQKEAIRDAIAKEDFSEKFPDVTFDELLEANPTSDEEILALAESRQKRYNKVKLDHAEKTQRVVTPTISASDLAEQEAQLKKPATESRFKQALKLRRTKVT